ncbi:MAG: tRNA (N(6)-L-threonylcarbamoyladenosine(37)-C(2))-methylthiotransferase MtaB, partial [Sulfuricurvum sp.]|nr:tRNA (N(6)-L-threonylcarbamoyladenosine(37)-C(2))-methylthiotransferase MtaB [Sulfuricurvum sp.]
ESNNRSFRNTMSSTPLDVLVETSESGKNVGYDQFFNKVIIESSEDLSGDWIKLDTYEVLDEYNMAKF